MRVGRRANELRPVTLTLGVLSHPIASAEIRLGRTRVLCAATIEEKLPPHRRGSGGGWVTAEYGLLPCATHTRSQRESTRGRPAGRSQEISRLIGRVLRAVVDLEALGERTIIIDCDVLDADGGTRVAAVTAASVVLRQVSDRLVTAGIASRPILREGVAGVSVGIVGEAMLLDLDYEEDSQAAVDLNVVFAESGKLVEVQGTGEGRPFSQQELNDLLVLAKMGAEVLFQHQRQILETRGSHGTLDRCDG